MQALLNASQNEDEFVKEFLINHEKVRTCEFCLCFYCFISCVNFCICFHCFISRAMFVGIGCYGS